MRAIQNFKHLWGRCDFKRIALIVVLLQQVEVGYIKVHCTPSGDETVHLQVSVLLRQLVLGIHSKIILWFHVT